MDKKHKSNQPYYTKPVKEVNSNMFENKGDWKKTGFYENSEVFPPRGSFINVPDDVLFEPKANLLDNIIEEKEEDIGSQLYNKSEDKNKR
ncbi:hypothetical protein RBU61_12580 [Tissierella sp. MB52-C2]|uniref:hypothetical protein n=1 Tax=Tissierella sp. MB52-C2 TaxID=3070999 RepID=UPI00280A6C75|nr:hypothetical protein [Tissierella sp. MB52-C2]WMM23757.1 hypothetical protein RBU61_12580 [Tissierella sp. MB52-C2]